MGFGLVYCLWLSCCFGAMLGYGLSVGFGSVVCWLVCLRVLVLIRFGCCEFVCVAVSCCLGGGLDLLAGMLRFGGFGGAVALRFWYCLWTCWFAGC